MTEESKLFCEFIYCGCGCGFTRSKTKYGRRATYIWGHHRKGKGKTICKYKNIKVGSKYVREHRYIYEQYYKCCLLPWIDLHHLNEKPKDNRIENLNPKSKADHCSLHLTKDKTNRRCSKCGSATTRKTTCGKILKTTGQRKRYEKWRHDPYNKDS